MTNKTTQVNGVLEFMQTSDPGLSQGCTNPAHQVAGPTEFCAVAPNICGSSVCVPCILPTFRRQEFLRWLSRFSEIFAHPLVNPWQDSCFSRGSANIGTERAELDLEHYVTLSENTFTILITEECLTKYIFYFILILYLNVSGDRGSTVVKVLCYNSEGRWFDPSWCQWNFS